MSRIRWEEPPAVATSHVRAPKYSGFASQLRKHPGQWAVLPGKRTATTASAIAHNAKKGKLLAFAPSGTFEAVARQGAVYVRYVGGDGAL